MFRTWTEPDIYPESAAWFLGPKVKGKYCSVKGPKLPKILILRAYKFNLR